MSVAGLISQGCSYTKKNLSQKKTKHFLLYFTQNSMQLHIMLQLVQLCFVVNIYTQHTDHQISHFSLTNA